MPVSTLTRIYSTIGIVFMLVFLCEIQVCGSCGGYHDVENSNAEVIITSPNYPGNYENFANCIWLVQYPLNTAVRINITHLSSNHEGETDCTDFLRITDGNSLETQRFMGCTQGADTVIQTRNRWMWIHFLSDWQNTNTGFRAVLSSVTNVTDPDQVNPIAVCQRVSFQCANKECISHAYVCEGENDCGCVGKDCDEHNCGGIGWTSLERMWCGIAVGVFVFCLLFFGLGALDIYLKRRHERISKAKLEEIDKNSKKRHRKPVSLAISNNTDLEKNSDGVTIAVPKNTVNSLPHTPTTPRTPNYPSINASEKAENSLPHTPTTPKTPTLTGSAQC